MININQTLLSKVTDSEAWMLIHMVGAIDLKSGEVILKNKTISEKTGYSITKINRLKDSLSGKGILEIHNRTRTDGGDACNAYYISSDYIGLYIGQKDLADYQDSSTGGVFTSEQGGCSPVNRGGVQNVGGTYSSIDVITPIDLDNKTKGGKPHFSLSIPEGYEASVNEWLSYKRELKKPYKTERSTQAMVDKLVKLSNGKPEVAAYMITTAIENNWQGFFEPNLEDIPSTEPIPLGYRLAAMRCGAKTDDQIRKIIPKFEGLNPDFVGLWFWHNKVVPDAENIRTLPNWIRDMKVEKNEIRKVYAKHKSEGVKAILEKSIEWTKTKL